MNLHILLKTVIHYFHAISSHLKVIQLQPILSYNTIQISPNDFYANIN